MKGISVTSALGCWQKADGTTETVAIISEYRINTAGETVLYKTRYCKPDGTIITLATGESVKAGQCVDTTSSGGGCVQDAVVCYERITPVVVPPSNTSFDNRPTLDGTDAHKRYSICTRATTSATQAVGQYTYRSTGESVYGIPGAWIGWALHFKLGPAYNHKVIYQQILNVNPSDRVLIFYREASTAAPMTTALVFTVYDGLDTSAKVLVTSPPVYLTNNWYSYYTDWFVASGKQVFFTITNITLGTGTVGNEPFIDLINTDGGANSVTIDVKETFRKVTKNCVDTWYDKAGNVLSNKPSGVLNLIPCYPPASENYVAGTGIEIVLNKVSSTVAPAHVILDNTVVDPNALTHFGGSYIVPVNATGAWFGHAHKIAVTRDKGKNWEFLTPTVNMRAQVVWGVNAGNVYRFTGSMWVLASGVGTALGDVKASFQTADHSGWVRLNGRAVSMLSYNQRLNAESLGFTTYIPNASNAVLMQNNNTLGAVSGSNVRRLERYHLPNQHLYMFGGRPTTASSQLTGHQVVAAGYTLTGSLGYDMYTSGSAAPPTMGITSSLSGGAAQQDLDITPRALSVNMFMFLGT